MLVAAGQGPDLGGLAGRFDVHGLDGPVGVLPHFLVAQADMAHEVALQVGDDGVVPDVPDAENTGGPAFLRQQGKAVFDGLPGGAVADLPAVEPDGAAVPGHGAEEVFQHFRPAGAVQTGNAQDLALVELEAGFLEPGVLAGQMLDLQNHLAGDVVLGREAVGQLPAHHQPDDLIHGQLLGRPGGHPGAVPHDGHIIADAQDLLHLVGDVNDAAALVAQHVDDAEQVLHLGLRQGGGGFVKDDDLGIVADSLGDLHHLPLGDRHGGHDGLGVHVDVQLFKNLLGALAHDGLADHQPADLGVTAQPEVVHNAAGQSLVELLVHHGHAVFQRFLGAFEIDFFSVEQDRAAVFVVDTEQALHQGGLSRAVFSHQRVNLSLPQLKVDAFNGHHAGEYFFDLGGLNQDLTHAIHPFFRPQPVFYLQKNYNTLNFFVQIPKKHAYP